MVCMEIARSGNAMILRLDHGEDILSSVSRAVVNETSTLMFSTGLGMIHDFELGFFDRGNYLKRHYEEPHELLSIQGSVAVSGEPRVHIHVSVADKEHKAFGGHLLSGRTWMSNEICLLILDGTTSRRELDREKNVGILRLE